MTLKTKDIERNLLRKGFAKDYGDHIRFVFMYDGRKTKINSKISHSHSEIGDDLISKMSKQLNMTKDFFVGFVECIKSESDYIETLNDKGVML